MKELVSISQSKLAERYAQNKHARALVNLLGSVPFLGGPVGATHDYLLSKYQDNQRAKLLQLLDRLATGEAELTDEVIESEPFLHCFFVTTDAIRKANNTDKIKIFSDLFIDFVNKGKIENKEEFDFIVNIINELSVNELKLMLVIETYEEQYYENGKFQEDSDRNGLLLSMVNECLGVTVDDLELQGWVVRLNRTGCYTMMGWRDGPAKDCRLTRLYYKVKDYIMHLRPDGPVKSSSVGCIN